MCVQPPRAVSRLAFFETQLIDIFSVAASCAAFKHQVALQPGRRRDRDTVSFDQREQESEAIQADTQQLLISVAA